MIAAASPHRADAFCACRYAIERVKQIAPVWKHEHFEGGDVWIEGATADPDDEAAQAARIRAGMLVTVRLFARLRELAGASELHQELPDGAMARTAWECARARAALRFAEYEAAISCAVNEEYARLTTPLKHGDEVAFLPPVSGG